MKKIIRRLAYLTGITEEIEKNERNSIAAKLMASSYWYGAPERCDIGNALFLYAQSLQNKGWFDDDKLRGYLDECRGITMAHDKNAAKTNKVLELLNLR